MILVRAISFCFVMQSNTNTFFLVIYLFYSEHMLLFFFFWGDYATWFGVFFYRNLCYILFLRGLCYLIGFFCLCYILFTLRFLLFHKIYVTFHLFHKIKTVIGFSFFGFFNPFFLKKNSLSLLAFSSKKKKKNSHVFFFFPFKSLLYFCKVEFYQPSYWLYSMPNLHVF